MLTTTKRNVLKILLSFCDLIGLIQLIMIGLKILMQNICKEKTRLGQNVITKNIKGLTQLFVKIRKNGEY